MKKNLKYYMSLKYEVQIVPIPESDGGGYEAFIPQLGRYHFMGDGESISEALADLERTKKGNFAQLLKEGTSIPEPKEQREEYSGRVLVRLPKYLHKALAEQASDYGISLNQHISSLLATGFPVAEMKRTLKDMRDLWDSATYVYDLPKLETPFAPVGHSIPAA